MKWETHGQKLTMEDTRKGKQAKESATTAEADWWLKTDELGDRYINPEKDGKRNMMGNKWMQDSRTLESQTGRQAKRDQWRQASRDRKPLARVGDTRGTEAGKEKHPESRTQWTQLCKPKAVTVSNSNLRDPIGRQLEDLGGSSETIGTQLRDNWGLNLLVADNWAVWGFEWNRRQLGKNRESTSGTKSELIGRPHLKDKRETTRWQVGHNILKDDWEKTGRQIEDTWRQWADQFWETNQNSGRQSEDNWELTPPRQVEDN